MKKYLLLIIYFLGLSTFLIGQNYYNIRLEPLSTVTINQACYNIQLSSAEARDFNLAGQNYRLFYDSKLFQFNAQESKSLLGKEIYTSLAIKDNFFQIDASGTGILPFEQNLGFINISSDLQNLENGGISTTCYKRLGEYGTNLFRCIKRSYDLPLLKTHKYFGQDLN